MKTKLCFPLLLLSFCIYNTTLHAQWQNGLWIEKQGYNWHFGVMSGLNFETSPPTVLEDSAIVPDSISPGQPTTFISGTGGISDAEGNLLFYTNGPTIWNADNEIMLNSTSIVGTINSLQNGLAVPVPGNPGHYYVFTSVELYTETGAFDSCQWVYSEVDMNLEGGLGDVTAIQNIAIAQNTDGKLSATYHADGEQIWVLIQTGFSNEFKAFLISETGISTTPVISNIGLPASGNSTMKVSPDGTKLATANPTFLPDKNIQVFNFNNETGEVTSSLLSIIAADLPGELFGCMGIEFSPNSRFIYTTSAFSGKIYQYDLAAGTEQQIKDSQIVIGQSTTDVNNVLQIAPDGKIYVAHGGFVLGLPDDPYLGTSSTLNVIEYPNNAGLASGFVQDAIDLGEGRTDASIPCFIQNYFASGILFEGGNCPGSTVSFSTLRIPGITEIVWNFGDPDSGPDNSSTALEPEHIFSAGGMYTVTALITSNGVQQTATTEVTILPAPEAIIPPFYDLVQCANMQGNATYNLTSLNATILNGQNADEYTVAYYASPEDIEAGSAIATPGEFITTGQVIYVVVTNTITGCTSTIQFGLIVNPLPVVNDPANIEECANASSSAVFDLTDQTSSILGGLDPEEYSITFYADPDLVNEILQPAMFESGGQTIYAKVTDIATGCSATVQFDILMLPLPSLPEISSVEGCSPFNLVRVIGEPQEGAVYSFHENEKDALGNLNAITNAGNYVVEGNNGSVYVRVLDDNGCVRVGELLIESGDCIIPKGISPNSDGKNDTFNLSGFDVKFLVIFNRYGHEVYSKKNYENEWYGQSDGGEELPSGTYYYMIESGNGDNKTGWVYINR